MKSTDESADYIGGISRYLSMIENFFFHYMPKKVNLGGYGFFCLKIYTSQQGENEIKTYGQCLDFHYRKLNFQSEIFVRQTLQEQLFFLLDIVEKVLEELNSKFEIDKEKFDIALKAMRANYPLKAEQILKVSKWHRSRKLRVNFVRLLELTGESIYYLILDKNNVILKEQLIKTNSSVYDASYDFRSSQWDNDKLLVFDRFDKQKLQLDLSEYLDNS